MLQITEAVPAAVADRVLRCASTRQYWSNGKWTPNPRAATVFTDTFDAVRVCVESQLTNVELVIRTARTHVEVFSTALR